MIDEISFEHVEGPNSEEFQIIDHKTISVTPLSGLEQKQTNTADEFLICKWSSKSHEVLSAPSISFKARKESEAILKRDAELEDEITSRLVDLKKEVEQYENQYTELQGDEKPDEQIKFLEKIAKGYESLIMRCMNANFFNKVEELYEKCLIYFTRLGKKDLLANAFDIGGEIFRKKGKYKESIAHYEKSLELKIELYGEESNSVSMTNYELSTILMKLCKFERATTLVDTALKNLKRNQKENLFLIVTIYLMQCSLLLQNGDLFETERRLNECQEMIKDHPDKSLSRSIDQSFLDLYIKRREHKKVKEIVEQTLKAELEKKVKNSVKIAKLYRRLGSTNTKLGKYHKAIENLKTALEIMTKIFQGDGHPEIAAIYYQLGDGYMKAGEYEKSKKQLENAIQMNQKLLGPDHPSVSSCFHSMGNLYFMKKEYEKSLEYYELSFQIDKMHYPEGHVEFGETYKGIGDVYKVMGKKEESKVNYEKALVIKKKMFGEDHNEVKRLNKLIEELKN